LIPYSTQHITLLDRLRVFKALGKPNLTQGPAVREFEHAVADFVGAKHAVSANSATSALHLACLALDLGPGDVMWTTPISFVASANCGRYCGAEVDFVDIDPETFNMSPQELKIKLETASKNGILPKVLVVVHLAGEPAEMREISIEARKHGVKIIEDASHALGSSYLGERVGSGTYSDITVFSFHAVKNMTTGEGGMAVTNDPDIAEQMKTLRSHGIVRSESRFEIAPDLRTPWHYEQHDLGFNYRITDFQATLGLSQLSRLEHQNSRRMRCLLEYRRLLQGNDLIRFQREGSSSQSATHLAIIRIPHEKREQLVSTLLDKGFATNLHYYPIHRQPYYAEREMKFSNAEDYAREAISLPCHSKLSLQLVRQIARHVEQVCSFH
jgi:UDP-4-amino-4,6-dideoxy-N-acetyl-beta-L-altrosamine transaminase